MNNQTIKSKLHTILASFLIIIMSFGSVANANVTTTSNLYEYQECNSEVHFRDDNRPIVVIKTLARQGDADAQYLLGRMYQSGGRLQQSMPHSMMWYRMAAKQNHQDALMFIKCVDFFKNYVEHEKKLLMGLSTSESFSANYSLYSEPVNTYDKELRAEKKSSVQYNSASSTFQPSIINYRERYSPISINGYKNTTDEPLSTLSIDVDTASYSHMRRYLQKNTLPPKDAIRIEEMINYFSYDYPQPEGDDPFSVTTEISTAPWNPEHQLVHIGLKGSDVDLNEAPKSNLVFLIDTSGSMRDEMHLIKQSLRMLVGNLRGDDRVAIVTYAGNAGVLLNPTAADNKEILYQAIEDLSSGGSTAGEAGIELAYKLAKQSYIFEGNNRVILVTDGDFNVGSSTTEELHKLIKSKRDDRVFLSVLGFGFVGNRDDIMEELADNGNGNYAYIDNLLEAKKVLVKEMGGTLYTIAKDVKLQVEFNPEKVKAYRLIGYENRLLNKEDFNDDKKDAGELGAGHTVTALYEIIPVGVDMPVSDVDDLKYQETSSTTTAKSSDELMTVKLRYKEPTGNTSKLITIPVIDTQTAFDNTSDNFRFSSAVAALGMELRDSEHKGSISFEQIQEIAKNAKGKDLEGYRAEFVRLVELAELLSDDAK